MKRSNSFFSSPSSSSSSKPPKKYDVFLSFRGEDTRNNFTGFLYRALNEKGIHTFLDDGLERGKDISEELLETIEESSCSIIVLSTNYANSTWCLKELVKILDCKNTMEQIVLPIFFLVEPTHVKNKTGAFGEAFSKHKQDLRDRKEKAQMTENERKNMEEDLKRWEDALTEVGKISGWHLTERYNQAKFIDHFVLKISREYVISPNIFEGLFGMVLHMEKLISYVYKSESGVEFIGICGMGGIGKTKIATTFYELKKCQFECSSFLENVKDTDRKDLKSFQEQLLSETLKGECAKIWSTHSGISTIRSRLCRKKVLVVIDDVDHLDQLKALAGKPDWFGSGSRIIITTRDKSLLIAHGVKEIYDVEPLDGHEGLQLFTWNAGFKDVQHLSDEYETLSQRVVEYADGLPLALEVLGSSLCGKDVDEWTDQLERLKNNPKKEIIGVLQISFDRLEDEDKNIFLLIVSFFGGNSKKDFVTSILDRCKLNPRIGIRNLSDKSLLSINDDTLWVHDLLKEMGWKILEEKSLTVELGRQIKVWNFKNASHVLKNCTAIEEIEAVVHFKNLYNTCPETVLNCFEVISKMKKLKLLRINDPYLPNIRVLPILQYLSNELIFLQWNAYPLKYFPSNFQPTQLVEVHMSESNICRLWDNIKLLPNLRSVTLDYCTNLTDIFDDFTLVPNLENLDLSNCEKLSKIDPSIKVLGKLSYLDLSNCSSLHNLPTSLNGMESLKFLFLNSCSKLQKLPEDIGYLKSLEWLMIRNSTAIRELPSSIVLLESLNYLYLGGCSKLRRLPEDIGYLKSLKELDIKDTAITELPSSIVLLENLRILYFDHVVGKNMFNTIFGKGSLPFGLKSLENLDLSRCNIDADIPEELGCFVSLEKLNLSYNDFVSLPASINSLSKLKFLYLNHCSKLLSLTELPSSLEMVDVTECTSLDTFLDPSNQSNLRCSAICIGCHKLASRQGSERTILTLVQRYIRLQNVDPDTSEILEIVLPGSKIPNWFIHKNIGSSISIKLDPNWCNSKWMGFALCLCFNLPEPPIYFVCIVNVKLNGQDWGHGEFRRHWESSKISDGHLWLLYLPRHAYFRSEWENSCGDQIEFSYKCCCPFIFNASVHYSEAKMCGFRMVYEQDVQEFNSSQV